MSRFEQSVMSAFKAFLLAEKGIELDFRQYAFLENQYGNTPCYKYSDAEKIVDCMFSFFSKYHVDFKGRFNRSMAIDSLRIQRLKGFLEKQLTYEINEDSFNAVNATKAPEVIIEKAFISTDDDNPCLCIDINEEACDFIRLRLNLKDSKGGCGVDGFINIQYPIYAESQTLYGY